MMAQSSSIRHHAGINWSKIAENKKEIIQLMAKNRRTLEINNSIDGLRWQD